MSPPFPCNFQVPPAGAQLSSTCQAFNVLSISVPARLMCNVCVCVWAWGRVCYGVCACICKKITRDGQPSKWHTKHIDRKKEYVAASSRPHEKNKCSCVFRHRPSSNSLLASTRPLPYLSVRPSVCLSQMGNFSDRRGPTVVSNLHSSTSSMQSLQHCCYQTEI